MRVINHPILEQIPDNKKITLYVDGKIIEALEGDTIASALLAYGKKICRYTSKRHAPRGVFCAIGRCSDCLMTVDGIPNIRTCMTPVKNGMQIKTQQGNGIWEGLNEKR
ncbi:(2Fe-2S)-binding protein [Petroclostridium sp. X23]|uniref:(2Fe-2S)-binding protein n=1 Tax=Petroclostridium sp. X23 TaxID=3045146 RepID=UPI0024AD023E|nr:(2Fe-2S)-binding protein [Petroclostridium sp. X23]WHH58134.1 (2Fe-2S)-binding protein [Petroclostridium sp. X23]